MLAITDQGYDAGLVIDNHQFNNIYGGTCRLFSKVFTRHGLTFTFVDTSDPANVAAAIRPETKLIWLESPTNPLLKLAI